jgi:CRP-like cAMP-binding protein
MEVQNKTDAIGNISFFQDLTGPELAQIAALCRERTYATGELCQREGEASDDVHIILKGRAGTVVRIPNITYMNSEIIIDVLHDGDIFGWSALIKSTPWSTLRALDPMTVLYISAKELLDLCENNYHIGYIIMKHLSSLIASRLRRNRMSMLNAIVAIRGD